MRSLHSCINIGNVHSLQRIIHTFFCIIKSAIHIVLLMSFFLHALHLSVYKGSMYPAEFLCIIIICPRSKLQLITKKCNKLNWIHRKRSLKKKLSMLYVETCRNVLLEYIREKWLVDVLSRYFRILQNILNKLFKMFAIINFICKINSNKNRG